jgi:HAD superfamily hydrolase (TIGR01509 family)
MNKTSTYTYQSVPTLNELVEKFKDLKGLFFDMDGTLFDTEKYHAEAMMGIKEEFNIDAPFSVTEVHELLVGKADYLVFDIIRTWKNFPQHWSVEDFVNSKNKNLLDILKKLDGTTYFPPPLFKLIKEAKEAGLKVALVTSSEKVITQELLKLTSLNDFFHLELTRDDCPKHKPDPWPYLVALEHFNLKAHETVIFEDSQVGLEAAVASGANVIKVEWH